MGGGGYILVISGWRMVVDIYWLVVGGGGSWWIYSGWLRQSLA